MCPEVVYCFDGKAILVWIFLNEVNSGYITWIDEISNYVSKYVNILL